MGKWYYNMCRKVRYRKICLLLVEYKVELGSGRNKEGEWVGIFMLYKGVESLVCR